MKDIDVDYRGRLMCGRYYVDDETAREIEKLIQQVDQKLRQDSMAAVKKISQKDICPAQMAPVLAGRGISLYCGWQRWGFPGFQGKQVIFNARCESAMEKQRTFFIKHHAFWSVDGTMNS